MARFDVRRNAVLRRPFLDNAIQQVGDPIALGLTSSISLPDRNITGFTISSLSLAAKRLCAALPLAGRSALGGI